MGHFASLAENDRAYLERWFAPQTLEELDRIEAAIRRMPAEALRKFYRVCLSNILRGVSWQKNDDLRVRREETDLAAGETVALPSPWGASSPGRKVSLTSRPYVVHIRLTPHTRAADASW